MSKTRAAAFTNTAADAARLLGRTLLGGLCGVGLVWTLTAAWPASKPIVQLAGDRIQSLTGDYPVVALGLLAGMGAALLWQALKR